MTSQAQGPKSRCWAREAWKDAFVFFKHEEETEETRFADQFLKAAVKPRPASKATGSAIGIVTGNLRQRRFSKLASRSSPHRLCHGLKIPNDGVLGAGSKKEGPRPKNRLLPDRPEHQG